MAACSGQPAGSRRVVRGARISETRLLRSHLHGKPASVRGPARWPGHCWFQIEKGRGQIYINYVDFLYHEQRIMLSNLIIAVVKDVVKVLLLLLLLSLLLLYMMYVYDDDDDDDDDDEEEEEEEEEEEDNDNV